MLSTMPMSSSGTCNPPWAACAQLAAVEAGQAKAFQPVAVGPIDGGQHVGAVARAADGDGQVSLAAVVHQLLDEDLVVADVVAHGHDPAQIVGEAQDFEPPFGFVAEVFVLERALAEVFGHVRGGRARAAVAEDEHEAVVLPGVEQQIGPGFQLAVLDAVELAVQPLEIITDAERRTEHGVCSRALLVGEIQRRMALEPFSLASSPRASQMPAGMGWDRHLCEFDPEYRIEMNAPVPRLARRDSRGAAARVSASGHPWHPDSRRPRPSYPDSRRPRQATYWADDLVPCGEAPIGMPSIRGRAATA